MKKNTFNKGFTLIELLVVIAIIGILSAVVLGALSSSRSKGADGKIQSQLVSLRTQINLYSGAGTAFDPDNAPGGTAPGDVGVCSTQAGTVFDTANSGGGTILSTMTLTNSRCVSAAGIPNLGSAWAVAIPLSTGEAWCVDSLGTSKKYTNAVTAIPNATTKCS